MDVVVTVPADRWAAWLAEGDAAGDPETGQAYEFKVPSRPRTEPGERVYVVALGKLRGYAPLLRIEERQRPDGVYLIRGAGAVAVTIPEEIRGFQGYRYRWWDRAGEVPFPGWRTP